MSADDAGDKPLDAFTQELIRENELLIADVDALRENEDRLIEQVEALQQQIAGQEEKHARQLSEMRVHLQEKDDEIEHAVEAKNAEIKKITEELEAVRHTLTLAEESAENRDEKMQEMEEELEHVYEELAAAREEIERLQSAAEETLAEMKATLSSNGIANKEAMNKSICSTLSEMSSNIKFMTATLQPIFNGIRKQMVFCAYGDPLKPFDHQPLPTLSITERDVIEREADITKMHGKFAEIVDRVKSFSTMGDDRAAEVGLSPADHPFRAVINASVESCMMILSLYCSISKVGLLCARNKYAISDSNGFVVVPNADVVGGGVAGTSSASVAAAPATSSAASRSTADKPQTGRGLSMWQH